MQRGSTFSDLQDSFIIFIYPFNPFNLFGYDLHKYSLKIICTEGLKNGMAIIRLQDGSHRIFLCARRAAEDISPQLSSFLDYIAVQLSGDAFVQKLHVELFKTCEHKEWRLDCITYQEHPDIARE